MSNSLTILLAKSPKDPANPSAIETLQGHTGFVVASARQLLDARGAASLQAAGLSKSFLPRLRRIVLTAAFMHDLGKCSAHFQAMLRGQHDRPQLVRHEALSLWLRWFGQ